MIYTIGYSDRVLPEFVRQLEVRGVTQLIDVRSNPWSRNPVYSRQRIEEWSSTQGIYYRFCGEILGGMSDVGLRDPEYISAISKIARASTNEVIAIMCAEGDPAKCHRTWSIAGSLLARHEIDPISVLRDNTEERSTQSILRVSKRKLPDFTLDYLNAQISLF